MLKKYTYFTFLLVILFLLLNIGVALAQAPPPPAPPPCPRGTELCYPDIGITVSGNSFGQYITYIFTFIVLSIGGIGAITIVYSGFKILLNFGKPETISQARAKIVDTVIGVTLLASSYLILSTINPELVTSGSGLLANLPPGVYFAKTVDVDSRHPEGKEYKSALPSVEDTQQDSFLSTGEVMLVSKCPAGEVSTHRVWLYTAAGLKRASGALSDASKTIDIPCSSTTINDGPRITASDNVLSFFYRPKDTGIYYFRDALCQGLAVCDTGNRNCSQKNSDWIGKFDNLPDLPGAGETQTVRCVEIVNGISGRDEQWGVVLSRGDDSKSECSDPMLTLDATNKVLNKGEKRKPILIPQITNSSGQPEDLAPKYAYIFHPSEQDLSDGVYLESTNLKKYIKPSKEGSDAPDKYIGAQWKHVAVCAPGDDACLDADFNPNLNELFVDPVNGGFVEGVNIYTQATLAQIISNKECFFNDTNSPCIKNIYSNQSHYNIILYARKNDRYFVTNQSFVGDRCMVVNGVIKDLKANTKYDNFVDVDSIFDDTGPSYRAKYDLYKIYIIPSSVSDR